MRRGSPDGNRRPVVAAVAEINVTPLIDVMLVLLILFMLVTPQAARGLDVGLPREGGPGVDDERTPALVVEVRAAGLALNGTPMATPAELGDRLRDLLASRPDRTVFVRPEGVAYRDVVAVLDVVTGAGADRVGLVSARR